jgi:hypothetical protein
LSQSANCILYPTPPPPINKTAFIAEDKDKIKGCAAVDSIRVSRHFFKQWLINKVFG